MRAGKVQFGIGCIKKMSGIVWNSKEDANDQDKLFGQTIICAWTFVDWVDKDGELLVQSYTHSMQWEGTDWKLALTLKFRLETVISSIPPTLNLEQTLLFQQVSYFNCHPLNQLPVIIKSELKLRISVKWRERENGFQWNDEWASGGKKWDPCNCVMSINILHNPE